VEAIPEIVANAGAVPGISDDRLEPGDDRISALGQNVAKPLQRLDDAHRRPSGPV
jgi:hypothetical protein